MRRAACAPDTPAMFGTCEYFWYAPFTLACAQRARTNPGMMKTRYIGSKNMQSSQELARRLAISAPVNAGWPVRRFGSRELDLLWRLAVSDMPPSRFHPNDGTARVLHRASGCPPSWPGTRVRP